MLPDHYIFTVKSWLLCGALLIFYILALIPADAMGGLFIIVSVVLAVLLGVSITRDVYKNISSQVTNEVK